MDELIKTLKELFNSTVVEIEDGEDDRGFRYFKSGELVDRVEVLCCEQLITEKGGCNWTNINTLRGCGYHVFADDKDSFGWLTGCVRKVGDKRILVYG